MRFPPLILILVMSASFVRAQVADEAVELRRRADALLARGEETDSEDLLALAGEVMDRLPGREGNRVAGRLLDPILPSGALHTDVGWTQAMRLRKRVMDDLDIWTGQGFFTRLQDADPERAYSHRRDLAWLCAASGRTELARAHYRMLLKFRPTDVEVALDLVNIHLRLEQTDEALDVCDSVAHRTGSARMHLSRGALLWRHLRDPDAARQAFDAARQAADKLPDEERAGLLASVDVEDGALQETVDRAAAVREHLGGLDRALIGIGLGWLLLLAGGGWFARRRGWL